MQLVVPETRDNQNPTPHTPGTFAPARMVSGPDPSGPNNVSAPPPEDNPTLSPPAPKRQAVLATRATQPSGSDRILMFHPEQPAVRHSLTQQATCRPTHAIAASCRPVMLLRKEVIQPHLPVRLPCYDLVPITSPTFDSSLHKGWATGFGCYRLS